MNRSTVRLPEWAPAPEGTACTAERFQVGVYDGGWLTSLRLVTPDPTQPQGIEEEVVASLEYHPSGRVSMLKYGGTDVRLEEEQDPSGMARPRKLTLFDAQSTPLKVQGNYAYDGSGNIWKIGPKRYAYDGLGRLGGYFLPAADDPTTWASVDSFEYDIYGNLETRVNEKHGTAEFDVSGVTNRLSMVKAGIPYPVSFAWDAGRMMEIPAFSGQRAKSLVYSADDRLLQVTDVGEGYVNRYAYDAGGERVVSWAKKPRPDDPGVYDLYDATFFIRDEGGQVLSEWLYTPPSDSASAYFALDRDYHYAGSRLIAQLSQPEAEQPVTRYVVPDHLGSTRWMFTIEGTTPSIVDTLDYYPFGELRTTDGDLGTSHLFTGHERDLGDERSQLDYMHARYYNPNLGRFLSVDPVGGEVGSSQSWNRYAYVRNNPLLALDSDGRNPQWSLTGVALVALERVTGGAATGAVAETVWNSTVTVLQEGRLPTGSEVVTDSWRGARIGAANTVPVMGATLATFNISKEEQIAAGRSEEEAIKHAQVEAVGAFAGAGLGLVIDKSNTIETGFAVFGARIFGAAIDFLGNWYPENLSSPEGSGDQLENRKETTEEVLKELNSPSVQPTPAD